MKIIFIRHAEPDYATDTLTEKGCREAELLAQRTKNWKVTDFYCSPLGRAKQTAEPTLNAFGREAVTCDWLREFDLTPYDPQEKLGLWDLKPEYLNKNKNLFDPAHWLEAPVMHTRPVKENYENVMQGFDGLLRKYEYFREGVYYRAPKDHISSNHYMEYDGRTVEHMKDSRVEETTIVCFCHLGVMLNIMSYLLNTTPSTLWQGIFIPPSSVTVLASEERDPGSAYFRCQMIGDTSHLREAGEPVSYYGYFTTPFQG